jgi:hypothetical protein
MPLVLRAGLLLGLLVEAWTFVMGFTGWYKDPALLNLFWLVILIQAGVLLWALRGSRDSAGYGRQVLNGVLVSAVASVLIFGGSLLFTTVVFPDYFRELEALGRETLAKGGLSPEQVEATLRAQAPFQTPLVNALMGVAGTLVTGLVVSLLAAIGLRRK